MENIFDRLQFVRGLNPSREDGIFNNREDAVNYVLEKQVVERPTVVGEPMVLRYDSGSATKGPNVILAIGSLGVGTPTPANRTFFIDIQKTEEEIAELDEKIENAIKALTLIPLESDTLDLHTEKTDDGTIISGDVKIADYRIVSGRVNENIIQTEGDKGLYAFVDMDYDPETFVITFNVNGVTKEFQLPVDQHVVKGWYDPREESIFLKLADDSQVRVLVTKLIEEWTVLPDGQTINDYDVSGTTVNFTPIVFARTHVGSKATEHEGIYEWQDVLEADIRVADHITDNILHKDRTGRYLYVKGTADNILYKDGQTVKDALDNVDCKVSTSAGNLIYKRPDGIYATAMLDYDAATNKIKYTFSEGNSGEIKNVEFQLNSVKLLEDITYDPVNETIVIRYIDAQGEYQKVIIPVKDIIEEWDVNNEYHNINLVKYRSQGQGKDILSADAKIHEGDNNILEDLNHELYVKGVASNIKYDVTGDTTVKDVLDDLSGVTDDLNAKIDQEIADRTADVERIDNTIGSGFTADPHENITYKFESLSAKVDSEIERSITKDEELETALNAEITRSTEKDEEHDEAIERIDTTIGSGFSTDAHETVTYKFEQLQNQVNEEAEKLQNEIDRSISADTVHDGRLDAIEAEIGDGFGPRNTVRDEIDKLQGEIDDVSAETLSRLTDVINEDHSINVETRNDENGKPTIKVIDVNLSEEVEDERYNIIKLNADGLFANVDLSYEETANKLIFHTSNGQPDKEIQLESMSSIISIEYIPSLEVIRITYLANGHEVKTTDVPVGDLINEWRVEDGHPHAVQLEKVRIASGTAEQDILKASVIITDDHDDNILVMDDGALYVPGAQIAANAAAISGLTDRMDAAEDDIRGLRNDLDDEIERATNKENEIINALNEEIARSTSVDDELTNALNEEIARSTEKDQELTDALNAENIRALSAETALQTAIDNERLQRETSEALMNDKIDDEIERSIAKDNELQNLIDTVSTNLTNEISRATDVENQLRTDLTAETNRALSAETALQTAIDNERLERETSETLMNDKIDDEIERSTEKDNELQSQINSVESDLTNEISRAQNAESQLANDLLTEIERATLSEKEIVNALSGETARATTQEEYLLHLIEDEAERRASGDTINANSIAAEESRAREAETRIETSLNNEIARAQERESELNTAIVNETLRANSADTQLYQSIADETAARISADANLQSQINQEASRAQVAETTISERLGAEINRSTLEDQAIRDLLTAETASREEGDAELEDAIRRATLTFDDTTSIDFTKTTGNVVTADVKLQEGDNIIKLGQGLYASVHLSYDPGTNKIKLVTSNGEDEEIQLVGASLLEDLHYDPTNKSLVITYKDATGEEHTVQFGVSELFNEWHVENPSEKSAVEMTKTPAAEPGGEDTLSARVLITDDRDGDGKPDPGSDNLVEIRNNGIYVNGSAFSAATATTECVESELKAIEKAIFGNQSIGECGEGFVYEAPGGSIYITSATTINNATYILDQSIKNLSSYTENVENKVNIVSADTDCAKSELKVVENNILGMPLINNCGEGDTYRPNEGTNYISAGTSFNHTDIILDREIKKANNNIDILNQKVDIVSGDVECAESTIDALGKLSFGSSYTIPTCGEGAQYPVASNGCIISAATSLYEADVLLDQAFCSMMDNWFLLGWDTPSNHTSVVEVGQNRHLAVDSRLSHGNHNGMSDDELVIVDNNGVYIDPTRTEFTDTNVIRLVNITDGPDHTVLPADNPYNGLYLSNAWDCGLYYSETVDAEAIAAAEAAGYITTNYRTDENSTASNYNYMNNVRQSDI